jgi:hypothetical protein
MKYKLIFSKYKREFFLKRTLKRITSPNGPRNSPYWVPIVDQKQQIWAAQKGKKESKNTGNYGGIGPQTSKRCDLMGGRCYRECTVASPKQAYNSQPISAIQIKEFTRHFQSRITT